MKRAEVTGVRKIEIVDAAEPVCLADEVKIRVEACGICGSDVSEYLRGPGGPSCLGHEFAGRVVEVGEAILDVREGDTVAGYSYGVMAFSQYVVVSGEHVVVLDAELTGEQGALIEPVVVAMTGLRHCGFRVGDTAFVAGCGSIGLLAVQQLRAFGARRIVVSEPNAFRRERAMEFGADMAMDPAHSNVEEAVVRFLGDRAEFAMECSGVGRSLLECARVTKRNHSVCAIGLSTKGLGVSSDELLTCNVKIHGVTPYDFALYESAMRMMTDGVIEPMGIVTHRFALEDVAEAFETSAGGGGAIKVLIAANPKS